MKYIFCVLILFSGTTQCYCQPLQQVENIPSKEIYDLMVDHKGYLWIGHNLGICRYDGINFLQYNNNRQSSLSMTDLVEDEQGRIWCHNFTGQVFYIENQRMKLFEAYDYKKEVQFPRIVTCNNEVLITSDLGLYVVDPKSLNSKYYSFPKGYDSLVVSITTINNKAVIFNRDSWFVYEKSSGFNQVKSDPRIEIKFHNVVSLQPGSLKDTIYLIANPEGVLQKLIFRNNTIELVGREKLNGFINNVSIYNNEAWVNTRNFTKTTDNRVRINDENLTDIVEDKEGNILYSSLKGGLLVKYKKPDWEYKKIPLLKNDFVRCITALGPDFFLGTQKGDLLLVDSSLKNISWEKHFASGYGEILFVKNYDEKRVFVASSIPSYIINPKSSDIDISRTANSVKNVDFVDDVILFSLSHGFEILPKAGKIKPGWEVAWRKRFPDLYFDSTRNLLGFLHKQRCRSAVYDKNKNVILASLKNGLFEMGKQGLVPYLYNNNQVMASSLETNRNKVFIATYNNGLLIDSLGRINNLTMQNALYSNTILKMKVVNNHLWLFENNSVQVLDCTEEKILDNMVLPDLTGAEAYDVTEKDGFAFIASSKGIYKVPFKIPDNKNTSSYIDYVLVNSRDTITKSNVILAYDHNEIQIFFSAPEYSNPKSLLFNYRLLGSTDEQWHTTVSNERVIRYASLSPGKYKFEIVASFANSNGKAAPYIFQFNIERPWWEKWWFYLLVLLIIMGIYFAVYKYRIRQLLKMENMRRKISSDLHDDIGATLSSINIYTELARKEKDRHLYINMIETHSTEVIQKLDDLVWSINPNNDSCEQLINRMRSFAEPFLHAAGILCFFRVNENVYNIHLNIDTKRNMFLIFKELINNVAKHSQAKNCYIKLEKHSKYLSLEVEDDGIGFDANTKSARNGLKNLADRVEEIEGVLAINSQLNKGTIVKVHIPC